MNTTQETPPEAAEPHPRALGWRKFAAGIGVLLIMLLSLLCWFSASQSGFAALWRVVGWASGQSLRVEQVEGSLWQGFNLQGVHYRDQANSIDIEHLRVNWQPRALWQRVVWIKSLDLGLVRVSPQPSAPASPWPSLPSSLSLPLDIKIERLHIEGVTIDAAGINAYELYARYRYVHQHHQITLQQMQLPTARVRGQMRIAERLPFALAGSIHLDTENGSADLGVHGSLQRMQLKGTVRASTVSVEMDGEFAAFDPQPFQRIQRLNLQATGVDPHALLAAWPQAAFDLSAHIQPDPRGGATGEVQIRNQLTGPWSLQRVPLRSLSAQFSTDGTTLKLASSSVQLTKGQINLRGTVQKERLALRAELSGIALQALDTGAPNDTLSGQAELSGSMASPRLTTRLNGRVLRADADLTLNRAAPDLSVRVQKLLLSAGKGSLSLSGSLDGKRQFNLHGKLMHANPAQLRSGWPSGDINAELSSQGSLDAASRAVLNLKFGPSRLSGAPLSGVLDLEWARQRLARATANLNLAGNRILAHGAYGAPGDRLQLMLDAPALSALGFGFGGALTGRLDLAGVPATPELVVNLKAQKLHLPGRISVQALSLDGALRAGVNGPFNLLLSADGVEGGGVKQASLRAHASGSRVHHSIDLQGSLILAAQPYHLTLQALGGWGAHEPVWRGVLQHASVSGSPAVNLQTPLALELGRERLVLGSGKFSVAGGLVTLAGLTRQANGAMKSSGRAEGINLALLKPWLVLPLTQNLIVDAAWDLAADGHGSVTLLRRAGDVAFDSAQGPQAIGLNQGYAAFDWRAGRTHFDLKIDSHLGRIVGQGVLPALPQKLSVNTPLTANFQLEIPDLAKLAAMTGGESVMGGGLSASVSVAGPLSHPNVRGPIIGHHLLWLDRKTGVRLSGGDLNAHLEGRRLILDRLRFAANGGEMLAQGYVDFSGRTPTAAIKVDIQHFSVYDRADRRLVVSGQGMLSVTDRLIALTGKIRADQGRLTLPKEGTPALSDDVMVIGRAQPEASAISRLPLSVALTLDLGSHFVFDGQGLKVELSGQVDVKAHPGLAPSARGQVRIVKGSYKAYGQELDIESGTITFVGPLDNPNLNVRARRHLSTVGAGVDVLGSVAAPKLQLIANESMSERDKLAWLVLGHAASDNAQDSNFLALAASSMAAGKLNQQMGLFDDLGMARRESRTALNGTVSPAEQVLTVGKQLTQTFYLGYEYGLTSSQQAVKLMYQLTSKWSLVLHVGTAAAAESRYTLRFD